MGNRRRTLKTGDLALVLVVGADPVEAALALNNAGTCIVPIVARRSESNRVEIEAPGSARKFGAAT